MKQRSVSNLENVIRRCTIAVCAAALITTGVALNASVGPGAIAASPAALTGVHFFGWGFNRPDAIVSDGAHVWVANYAGDSITELHASNGGRIRTIAGSHYAFASPVSIASSTGQVWVANRGGNSITELSASTGALVRVISGIHGPAAITTNGTDVWVAGHYRCGHAGCVDHSQVTELSASTGHVVRLLSGPSYGFADPTRSPRTARTCGSPTTVAAR